ncbi:MAG: hypothetical protein DRP69_00995 [Candidatus Duberdicusella sinuisediminis]|nr:MAG: hypothetical protein DRP69_00995 [Candidatus Omnitrophota bacterium]
MDNKKLAILIHPVNRELLYLYEPGMRTKSISIVKKVLEWMSPFKASDIEGIKSQYNGKEVKGELIMCPLLAEQVISLNPRKIFFKVKRAAKFAESRGANLLGLVAYTALVGEKGLKLKEHLNIPMTTGHHLTIATLPEAVLRALREAHYNLEEMIFLIFGLNPLSFFLVSKLGNSAKKIYIYSQNREKFKKIKSLLPLRLKKKVEPIGSRFKYILKWVNFIAVTTNRIPSEFNLEYLRKGTIILDTSYPRKIVPLRKDVLVIDGVAMKPPGEPKFNFNFGLPEGLCFPCIAEPLTLFLEDRFESYSLGKDFFSEKAEEIFRLSLRHGFQIEALTSRDYLIPQERILEFKESIRRKERSLFFLKRWLGLKN